MVDTLRSNKESLLATGMDAAAIAKAETDLQRALDSTLVSFF